MPEPPPIPIITSASQLQVVCDDLRASGRFAFDTEFVSEQTFAPVLCLIQVATTDRVAVIDPLTVSDLTPFWDVLLDPAVEVVMHAAGEDLRITRQQTGQVPARVFDVQLVAGLVGFGYPMSLGNLLSSVLRVSVSSGETRTDWRRRPLSPAQLRYAADDVRFLLAAADDLKGRLERLGRTSWAEAELAEFLADVRDRQEEDRWLRLSGLHQLNRRGLEVARRLSEWRSEDARRHNRPLRYLLRDDLLVAIAKRQPANRRDLEALRDFNRPGLMQRAGELLDLIARGREVPDDQLPEHSERPEEAPGASMLTGLLSAALHQCCNQAQVAVGLTGTASDLRELVRWHLQGHDPARAPALVQGWRREVCGETLMGVLEGKRSLRVVDPAAEVPVALDPVDEG
jgi:ribonuclease D